MRLYEKLNGVQKEFCQKVFKVLMQRGERVSTPTALTKEKFLDCVTAVQYHFPELFFVNFRIISYIEYADHLEYNPKYLYSYSEIKKKQKLIRNVANEILKRMYTNKQISIYQRCGWIHNYMVRKCVYDYEVLRGSKDDCMAYSIEGFFLKGSAVCQGMALAFRYLCLLANIDAIVVCGKSLQPGHTVYEEHAWNIVRAEKAAAHIDVTWDMCLSAGTERIRYDYFFLPDLEMMKDHQYVGCPVCRQLKCSYFERTGVQFSNMEELGAYVQKSVAFHNNKADSSAALYLYFKVKNREQTKDGVKKYVEKLIKASADKGFSYMVSVNEAQSVFSYSVNFKG